TRDLGLLLPERLAEGSCQSTAVGVSVGWVFARRCGDDPIDSQRELRPLDPQGGGPIVEVSLQQILDRSVGERMPAGQRLVDQEPEAVDVRGWGDRPAVDLFRREV